MTAHLRNWLLCCVAALLLFSGCVIASVRVVQTVAVERPRERVYVVVHEGSVDPQHARELARATQERLASHVGAHRSTVLTGIEFDTAALDRDIAALDADGVLVIKPIGSRTGRYGEIVQVTWAATLHDRTSNSPLWAAKVESAGGAPGFLSDAVRLSAEKIVEALVNDRILRPAVATR
jgi:hypothetical protein